MCALIKFNGAVSPLYNQNIYVAAYVLYEDDSGRNRLENSSDDHGARKCRNNHARLCKRDQSASPEWDDANGGKDEAEVELSGLLNEEKVDMGNAKVDIENEKVNIENVLSEKDSNFSVKTTVHIHRLFCECYPNSWPQEIREVWRLRYNLKNTIDIRDKQGYACIAKKQALDSA